MRDDVASAYVLCLSELPLSQFMRDRISKSRQMREAELVENLSQYSNWREYMKYYSLYTQGCSGVQGFHNSGCQ
jgi:hypothetical protein